MKILRFILQELFISGLILASSTLLLFLIAFYAAGDLQKEQLGITNGAISAYIGWWQGVLTFDFGGNYQNGDFLVQQVSSGFYQTLELVLLALIFSAIIALSLALFLVKYHGKMFANVLDRILYLSGAIPVFLLPVVIYDSLTGMTSHLTDATQSFIENLPAFIIAAIVLSFGSGVLGELVRLCKNELYKIMHEPFIHAARARGASLFYHISIASVVPLSSVMVSRLPYFVGAAIIVESSANIHGLGNQMIESGTDANFAKLMLVTLVIVLIVIVARLVNKAIVAIFDPRVE